MTMRGFRSRSRLRERDPLDIALAVLMFLAAILLAWSLVGLLAG